MRCWIVWLMALNVAASAAASGNTPGDPGPVASQRPERLQTALPQVALQSLQRDLAPLALARHGSGYRAADDGVDAKRGDASPAIEKYRFEIDGIPVLGIGMRVRIDPAGEAEAIDPPWLSATAASAGGESPVDVATAIETAIDAWRARAHSQQFMRGVVPTLAYEADVRRAAGMRRIDALRLVWRIGLVEGAEDMSTVAADANPFGSPIAIAVVDAVHGDLVRFDQNRVYDDVDMSGIGALGHGQYNTEVPLDVQPIGDPQAPGWDGRVCLADTTRTESMVTGDPCGAWPVPGIHTFIQLDNPTRTIRVVDNDFAFGNGRPALTAAQAAGEEGRTTAADAHYGAARAYDFFYTQFKRKHTGDYHNRVRVVVNQTTKIGTHWSVQDETIYIGRADAANPNVDADLETLGHEYTHAVMENEIGGMYETPLSNEGTEYGAINEGVADIFGVLVDAFGADPSNEQLLEPAAWILGDRTTPDMARRFDMPSLGADPGWDEYQPGVPFEVHQAGGVIRRAFHLMAYGTAPSDRGSGGMPGIGLKGATQLLYKTIVDGFAYGDQPTFRSFRDAMVGFAADTYKLCTPPYKTVVDAWATVNVGAPADRVPPDVRVRATRTTGGAHVIVDVLANAGETPRTTQLTVDDQPAMVLVLQASSDPLKCRVSIGALGKQCFVAETDVTLAAGRAHRISATADDGCMNFDTDAITVDYAAPTALALQDLDAARSPRRRLRISAQDDSPLSAYRLEVGTINTTGTFPAGAKQTDVDVDLAAQVHGSTFVKLTVTDAHGNSTSQQFPYVIDRRVPTYCYFSTGGAPSDAPQNLVVGVYGKEDAPGVLETMELTHNGNRVAWADRRTTGEHRLVVSNSGSFDLRHTVVNPPNGTHQFAARCVDGWGNEKLNTHTLYKSPPPTIDVTTSATTSSITVNSTGRSQLSKIERIEWYENGTRVGEKACNSDSATCSGAVTLAATSGQRRTIETRVWDHEYRQVTRTDSVTALNPPTQPINSPLAFTLDELTNADFDMVITDPTGYTFTYTDRAHYVQDTISGSGPDIAYWQNPPRGTYQVLVKIYSGNGAGTSFSLKARRNGSQALAPNFPSSQVVFAVANFSGNTWGPYSYTY